MTGLILCFKSAQDAVAGERKLMDAGMDARLIPAPKTMGPGCGMCLMVNSTDIGKVRLLLGETIRELSILPPEQLHDSGAAL